MNAKKKTGRKPAISTCTLISGMQTLSDMVLTADETKVLNALCFYKNADEGCRHIRMDKDCFVRCGRTTMQKMIYLYTLKSPEQFLNGIVSTQEYLNAPIILHKFSTRLDHLLEDLELFTLNEVIEYGTYNLKRKRGFGAKCLKEIKDDLELHGCGHLLI